MAKKMYVGANVEPYLDNNKKRLLVNTPIDYIPRIGFELDFVYLGGTTAKDIHQIINVGGIVGNTAQTKFSFYANRRTSSVVNFNMEYYDGTTLQKLSASSNLAFGQRLKVSFKVDMTQGLGTYELKDYNTGTIIQKVENLAVDTTYTTSLGKVSIYNQELWNGSTSRYVDRSVYIKLYNLKLYDGETLVANYVPTGTNYSDGYLYDTISQQQLSYNEVCTQAPAIYRGGEGAEEVKKAYIGVNGEAKEITKAYVGVNGQAKLFYEKI